MLLTLLRFPHFKICDSQEHPDDLEDARDTPDVDKLIRSSRIEDLQHHKDPDLNFDSGDHDGGRMDVILTTLDEGGNGVTNQVLDFPLNWKSSFLRPDCGR